MRPRFTIPRFALAALVALALGWWLDHRDFNAERDKWGIERTNLRVDLNESMSQLKKLAAEHDDFQQEVDKAKAKEATRIAIEHMRALRNIQSEWDERTRHGMHFYPPKKLDEPKPGRTILIGCGQETEQYAKKCGKALSWALTNNFFSGRLITEPKLSTINSSMGCCWPSWVGWLLAGIERVGSDLFTSRHAGD